MNNKSKKIIVFSLILGLNWAGLSAATETLAYYVDTETSLDNVFRAGLVDFSLAPSLWSPLSVALNMEPGTTTEKTIGIVQNPETNPFQYFASTTNFSGDLDFCGALSARAVLSETEMWNGSLINLHTVPMLSPATTTIPEWKFTLGSEGDFQNKVCSWNFDFNGWQTRNNLSEYPNGFSDTETATATVSSNGFRINKIYSNVDEGTPREELSCPARSPGYWKNNEGCDNGTGASVWQPQLNVLSATLSSVFATTTGEGVCSQLAITCPGANTKAGALCKAKTHMLADELNVVSGNLDLDAIIASAYDGNVAFTDLGLGYDSTLRDALGVVETIIANPTSTTLRLNRAKYVAERIYAFYENENPGGMCVYDPSTSIIGGHGLEGENEWVELYNQTDTALDISGWSLCDDLSCRSIPPTPLIPAKGFAVASASSTTWNYWHIHDGVQKIELGDLIGGGLGDDADMLTLKRPDGIIFDQVNWGTSSPLWVNWNDAVWTPAGVPAPAEGNMLSRKPTGYDTDQPSDWGELSPPSVDLISPDENINSLTWYWGSNYEIHWTAANANGPDSDLSINLYYIKDINHDNVISAGDTIHLIAENTENDGSHEWNLPSGFIGYIWVKVVATGPENPMVNAVARSGRIYDPVPPLEEEEFNTEEFIADDNTDQTGVVEGNPELVASQEVSALIVVSPEETPASSEESGTENTEQAPIADVPVATVDTSKILAREEEPGIVELVAEDEEPSGEDEITEPAAPLVGQSEESADTLPKKTEELGTVSEEPAITETTI